MYYPESDFSIMFEKNDDNFMYDLDPNYDKNLTENKFLKTYKFANEEDELVNADGHT